MKSPKMVLLTNTAASSLNAIAAIFGLPPVKQTPLDPINIPPTLDSPQGRAWELPPPPVFTTTWLRCWIIERPDAHPAWHSYMIALYALRDVEGATPAVRYAPGVTHEFMLLAIDPEADRQLIVDGCNPGGETWQWLTPPNFGAQFTADGDDAAVSMIREQAVRPVVDGDLNPDVDGRADWIARFGSSLIKS